MTEFLREELRKAVRDGLRKPLVICGAGVSTQATDGLAPSWASLIKSGITRVADLDANARKWANESRQTLITGNTATWITVADDVTERLGGPHNAEFATWLRGRSWSTIAGQKRSTRCYFCVALSHRHNEL